MPTVTVSTTINAPQARVFEVFTDLRSAPQCVSGIKSLDVLTDGPIGLATRFRETRVMFGKEASETMEITAFNPPNSYEVTADSHGCHYHSLLTFTPQGPNATTASMTFNATAKTIPAKLMGALMGWMVKGACRKAMQKDFDDLKRAIESAY
ncbi:MAG: SRPBCC family protein [Phycisphaerales bacterium]